MSVETVAYLFLIDGCPTAFATSEGVGLAYVQTLDAFTAVHYGLRLPTSLSSQLDITSGLLQDTSATITIRDVDGTLADLFASSSEDATELLAEVRPSDTPTSDLWGKHVGTELIGPAGERRQCSCVPGWNVGMHHYGSAQAASMGAGETPVSDSPIVWAGRRACLYRLVRTASGGWPDLTDGTARRSALVWFGTFLGQGSPSQHSWPLRFAGPESWAMGNLATGLRKDPVPVRAALSINPVSLEEPRIYGKLVLVNPFDNDVLVTYSESSDLNAFASASSVDDVIAALNTFIASLVSDAGSGSAFEDAGLSTAYYSTSPGQEGIVILWDRDNDPNFGGGNYTARLRLTMHPKIWQVLGYDPSAQLPDLVDVEDELFAWFNGNNVEPSCNFYSTKPAGDALILSGDFSTIEAGDLHNNGNFRRWAPLWPGGAQVWDTNAVAQEFVFRTLDPLYLVPTKATPLMSAIGDLSSPYSIGNGVGEVTATGLLAIRGPYRTLSQTDDEAVTLTQVIRICWREQSDGSVAVDDDGYPRAVVYRWELPRLYGIDADQVTGTWASFNEAPEGMVKTEARQLVALEHEQGSSDSLVNVFARLLVSTGDAGEWYTDDTLTTPRYGLGYTQHLDTGANDLGLAGYGDKFVGRFTDAEAPNLGRGIPAAMVASTVDQVSSIEAGIADGTLSELMRCKVTIGEPASLRKILDGMLRVTGWGMSLAGGRFGLFSMWDWRSASTLGLVDVETYVSDPGDPIEAVPTQDLRELSPIDLLGLKAVRDVTTSKFAREITRPASDPGSQYRGQTILRDIEAPFLVHPRSGLPGSGWATDFAVRWDAGFRWWASQHFKVTFKAALNRQVEFWPGDIVAITDDWLVNPTGGYGLASMPGFVIARTVDTEAETVEVQALVNGSTFRVYAPAFVATEYDDTNHTITGYADWLDCRTGLTTDVDGFIEPAWSDEGGNAGIEVLEFNGVEWSTLGVSGVTGIDLTTPSAPVIELTGALTGTWRRDRHHLVVLRDYTAQGAPWVARVYAPVCDKAGKADGTVLGSKFIG